MTMKGRLMGTLCTITSLIVWSAPADVLSAPKRVEIVGHRGARGLAPENTLPGFAKALGIGVHAVELDVGVTRDGEVVISHDQRLNPNLTRSPDGSWLSGEGRPITRYSLAELKTYDVGRLNPSRRYASKYPEQQPVDGTRIPTLKEVIALARKAGNPGIRLDVEIKGNPEEPEVTLPPEAFAEKVIQVLRRENAMGEVAILSFDWRVLRHVQRLAPELPTVCLTAEERWLNNLRKGWPGASPWTAGFDVDAFEGSVPRLVRAAGCKVWSVYYRNLTEDRLREAHDLGLRVMVWTVNDSSWMRKFIALGVDGIVTDYPNRLRKVMEGAGMDLPRPVRVSY